MKSVADIEAGIAKLKQRIAMREERGRSGVKAQAVDRAALERAVRRLSEARDHAAKRARNEAKAARRDAYLASVNKRLDALAAAAPDITERWKRERAQEPKRLKKLKKKLAARTYKDHGGAAPAQEKPGWMLKPITLPPPVEQPKDLDLADDAPLMLLDRPDLLPGTFSLIDPSRMQAGLGLVEREPLPAEWTAEHVGYRLIEAHEILRRMPMNLRPAAYGSPWPEYRYEAGDLVHQASTGTIEMGRGALRRSASSDEVARCNEAIAWPLLYLSGSNALALGSLNAWADDPGEDHGRDIPPAIRPMLDAIAAALTAAGELVR